MQTLLKLRHRHLLATLFLLMIMPFNAYSGEIKAKPQLSAETNTALPNPADKPSVLPKKVVVVQNYRAFKMVDLEKKITQSMSKKFAERKDLTLPPGVYVFGGVAFRIEKGIVQLGSTLKPRSPDMVVGIDVNNQFSKLYVLHGTAFGGGANVLGRVGHVKDGTDIGKYVIIYEDKSQAFIPIVYGKDVRDWWFLNGEKKTSHSKIVFESDNVAAARRNCRVRFYMTTWDNPHPDKKVVSINYISRKNKSPAAPFCVAISYQQTN